MTRESASGRPGVVEVSELAAYVKDGASIVAGGLPLWRKPLSLVRAVTAHAPRHLRYSSFLASLDVELLSAAGCLAELEYGYLGRDLLGASRLMSIATDFRRRPRTEFEYWAGIRAGASGQASQPDAFGAPVPAKHFDLCILHASLIDGAGAVYSHPLDAMEDDDRLLAAVADRVLVTVEREVATAPEDAILMLAPEKVAAVAVCPGGARPLGMADFYPPDLAGFDHPDVQAPREVLA